MTLPDTPLTPALQAMHTLYAVSMSKGPLSLGDTCYRNTPTGSEIDPYHVSVNTRGWFQLAKVVIRMEHSDKDSLEGVSNAVGLVTAANVMKWLVTEGARAELAERVGATAAQAVLNLIAERWRDLQAVHAHSEIKLP